MLHRGVFRNLFINRDFGLLLVGRLVSQIGDGIHHFAVVWLVLDLTGSGAVLGTLLMTASIPGIVFTPLGGVLADMLDRRKIVIFMDVARGLLILLLAAIYASGLLTLPVLYIITILLSLCGVLFGPAIVATLPGLVKRQDLVRANARDLLAHSATGIIGPIVGAVLLARFGYLGIFLINGVSFLISALSEAFIRFPEQGHSSPGAKPSDFSANLKEGFHYLWANAGLRLVVLGGIIINFVSSPLFGVVFPYFGKEILRMTPEHYGLSQSGFPAGMLLGAIVVGSMARRLPKLTLLVGGVTVQGIMIMSLAILAWPAVYLSLPVSAAILFLAIPLLIIGAANVQVGVPLNSLLQETVPEGFRGRVLSLVSSTMNAAAPLGMGLAGVFLDIIPVRYFFLFCGANVAAVALALRTSPALHRLCAEASQPARTEQSSI